ncbi:MAG TPA: UDP-3-O-(3-hydroxymyristoyl)glucosamine N-acyltransferase [Candidatus Binatia bacterium]|nr:UDP-3-O-(3-hydroxymyristoyl)glucosamine N-acyltransferase [Candidatus Binatia bacterium]
MKLSEIARAVGCELRGDGAVDIRGVASIEDAEPGMLTFVADRRHARRLATTRAAAVVLAADAPEVALPSLRAAHPYLAFVAAVELFHPRVRPAPGMHPTAVVAPSARLGPGATVGPHVVVGEEVVVGRDAVLHAGVAIYPRVRIGDEFTAHAGVVVREDVRIGDRVTLHAGAVIGSDGFGYVPQPTGHRKIPQVGTVVLEDDVEIGANATVDRAALGATVVGRGTKIDNLVMVGHGSRLGPGCLLAAQVGLAGGTTLGGQVMLGGQVGVAGHLTVGDRAQVGARSGVHADVPAGAVYSGYPATEVRRWNRAAVAVHRLPEVLRRLRRIERALGLAARVQEE